jgi:hypothetical protein
MDWSFRIGARDRNRTYTALRPLDFESSASASSATRARREDSISPVLRSTSQNKFDGDAEADEAPVCKTRLSGFESRRPIVFRPRRLPGRLSYGCLHFFQASFAALIEPAVFSQPRLKLAFVFRQHVKHELVVFVLNCTPNFEVVSIGV